MSNARTLANTINSSSQIVVPSGGIQFADATNANTVANQSNLIDQDGYEEGSFTPSFANASGTVYGRYTKIGNLVYVYGEILSPSITGTVSSISGLPFTNNTGSSAAPTYVAMVRRDYLNYDIAGFGVLNQSNSTISSPAGINGSALEITNATTPFTWTTNDILSFSFFYRT